MFAESIKLDQSANRGCMGQVPGSRQAVLVLRGPANVHVLVNLESVVCVCVCVCVSALVSASPRGGEDVCFCVMWVQYAGAAEGSSVSVAVCVTSRVSVFWDTGSASLLVEPADRKAAAMTLSLDRKSVV